MSANWYTVLLNKGPDSPAEVMMYDEIGESYDWSTGKKTGISSRKFAEDFAAIKAKTINIRINSVGGEVFEGFAIANAIKAHPAVVNVKVDSLAASIAAVIAMAGDSVCIAKNGYLMIHEPKGDVLGDADEHRQLAAQLDQLANTIGQTFADKSGKPLEDVRAKMRDETWFDAQSAKDFGIVDSIAGDDEEDEDSPRNSATVLKAVAAYKKVPESLRKIAARASDPTPPKHRGNPMAKPFERDGKKFIKHGDEEIEIEGEPVNATATKPTDIPPGVTAAQTAAAIDSAKTEAVKAEKARRKEFNAILNITNITGKDAEELEQFYDEGLDLKQIKFLAGKVISNRAKPLGEGSGNSEVNAGASEIEVDAGKRFDGEIEVRRMYGLRSDEPRDSKHYNAIRARYVAGIKRQVEDEKKGK